MGDHHIADQYKLHWKIIKSTTDVKIENRASICFGMPSPPRILDDFSLISLHNYAS